MATELLQALRSCETDVDGALKRFFGNEALYCSYLVTFVNEPTMMQLDNALLAHSWDDAFISAHALKGLAANLGFVPLYHATGELILLLRAGKLHEVVASCEQIWNCYYDVINAIRKGSEGRPEVGGEFA